MEKTDYDIIYDAIVAYGNTIEQRKGKPKRIKMECNQISDRMERCLITMEGSTATMIAKNKRLGECKSLFQRYSAINNANPKLINESLNRKAERLIKQICLHEEAQVALFREREVGGDKISLEAVLLDLKNVKKLMSMSIKNLLEAAMKDEKYTIIAKEDQT